MFYPCKEQGVSRHWNRNHIFGKKWERNIEIKRITNEILGVKGLKILFGIDILSISPFYSFRHKSAV